MTETTTTQRAPAPDPALMELEVLAGDWDTDALGDRNVTIQLWWYDVDSGTYRTRIE